MLPVMVNGVGIDCINRVAIVSHVPATVILSVMKVEGGKNGDAVRNKNGTFDYGVFQINSIWLPIIARYGYTRDDVQFNACKNAEVAAWILSQCIANGKSIWSGVGDYHSHTPSHNQKYSSGVRSYYQKLDSVITSLSA